METNPLSGHQPSTVIVYSTTDYSRFKFLHGNRVINDIKVNRIIKEIKSGNDMLRYYPIQVKENGDHLDILDGQHRYYIDQKLKRPVYYIIVQEQKSMPDIAKVNSNVEKWKSVDFINCYMQHGDENYKTLHTFLEGFKISLSVSLLLLSTGAPGTEGTHRDIAQHFKDGLFKVNHAAEAIVIASLAKQFETFPNWRSRAFIIAIYRIKKAGLVSIDELLTAYKKRPEMLTQQANYKAYVNILEQILNVGKQKRIVII